MNCPRCQAQVIDGAAFCDSCGAPLPVQKQMVAAPANAGGVLGLAITGAVFFAVSGSMLLSMLSGVGGALKEATQGAIYYNSREVSQIAGLSVGIVMLIVAIFFSVPGFFISLAAKSKAKRIINSYSVVPNKVLTARKLGTTFFALHLILIVIAAIVFGVNVASMSAYF